MSGANDTKNRVPVMSGMGILFLTLLTGTALRLMKLISWADHQTQKIPEGEGKRRVVTNC